MHKLISTTSTFGKSAPYLLDKLKSAGFELILNPFKRRLTETELCELLAEHQPVGMLAGVEPITKKAMQAAAGSLKVISRVGVGWDNVDHDAAKILGIKVCRTKGVLNDAVAELVVGMILGALRNIAHNDREIRNLQWQKHMGRLFKGKTLGIIGFGAIGQRVAELAMAFGAKVTFYDPFFKDGSAYAQLPLAELLKQSDIISIHASGSDCILSDNELKQCKVGVIIVNTARGTLIDEKALVQLLKSGHIGYACLDVFENEPYSGELVGFDNVIMTSHIGSYAIEARIEMEKMSVDNFLNEVI